MAEAEEITEAEDVPGKEMLEAEETTEAEAVAGVELV